MISARDGRGIPIRIYRPSDAPPAMVVFFHGGGWVYGDLDSHDGMCRDLAADSNAIVASVEYRLAPEHPFPSGLNDALDAVEWAMAEAGTLGVDASAVGVAGDSSGGNLAAAVSLARRDAGLPVPVFQLLLYPSLDLTLTQPSMLEAEGKRFGGQQEIAWTVDQYLGGRALARDPLVSPLLAEDHRGLPATHMVTAGYDPLVDEGVAYVRALRAAGVPVTHRHYDEQIHGFLSFAGILPDARQALADAGRTMAAGISDARRGRTD
jgi:acetyl esterase